MSPFTFSVAIVPCALPAPLGSSHNIVVVKALDGRFANQHFVSLKAMLEIFGRADPTLTVRRMQHHLPKISKARTVVVTHAGLLATLYGLGVCGSNSVTCELWGLSTLQKAVHHCSPRLHKVGDTVARLGLAFPQYIVRHEDLLQPLRAAAAAAAAAAPPAPPVPMVSEPH